MHVSRTAVWDLFYLWSLVQRKNIRYPSMQRVHTLLRRQQHLDKKNMQDVKSSYPDSMHGLLLMYVGFYMVPFPFDGLIANVSPERIVTLLS
jgi:hypothetical protein